MVWTHKCGLLSANIITICWNPVTVHSGLQYQAAATAPNTSTRQLLFQSKTVQGWKGRKPTEWTGKMVKKICLMYNFLTWLLCLKPWLIKTKLSFKYCFVNPQINIDQHETYFISICKHARRSLTRQNYIGALNTEHSNSDFIWSPNLLKMSIWIFQFWMIGAMY